MVSTVRRRIGPITTGSTATAAGASALDAMSGAGPVIGSTTGCVVDMVLVSFMGEPPSVRNSWLRWPAGHGMIDRPARRSLRCGRLGDTHDDAFHVASVRLEHARPVGPKGPTH